jgi:hypothetical protein
VAWYSAWHLIGVVVLFDGWKFAKLDHTVHDRYPVLPPCWSRKWRGTTGTGECSWPAKAAASGC